MALLDPRSPRDKRTSEHEAGSQAAERVLTEAIGPEARLAREEGRPIVAGAEGFVSITHGHGLAVAAAQPSQPVGVDLERIEQRSDAWREDNLTTGEQQLIAEAGLEPEVGQTLAWTLKEAAAKALGTGLEEPATSYHVTDVGEDEARVETPDGAFAASWTRIGGLVVSVATPEE